MSQACKEEWPIYTDINPSFDSMKILANICKGNSEKEKLQIARDNINAIEVGIYYWATPHFVMISTYNGIKVLQCFDVHHKKCRLDIKDLQSCSELCVLADLS